MKKLFLVIIGLLAFTIPVMAATLTPVTVTWTYVGNRAILGGFNIYKGPTKVCTTTDSQAVSLACSVPLTVGANTFTMTAFNREGIESGASAPFILQNHDPIPNIPAGLRVIKKNKGFRFK